MSYRAFTLKDIEQRFHLRIAHAEALFPEIGAMPNSDFLQAALREYIPLALAIGITTIIYGAVTTGTIWRFLRQHETTIAIDQREYSIDAPGTILAMLLAIVQAAPHPPAPHEN
jgi:hypothetical protein